MNNSVATINSNFEEDLFEDIFAEAATEWELQRLYQNIEATKQEQFGQKSLTPVQKACLRGLLCGYSPEKIASQLPEELQASSEGLTWRMCRCIQTMTGHKPQELESYTDIFQWLEAAGYKKTLQPNTPELQKPHDLARSDRRRMELPTSVSDRIQITPETENSKLDHTIEKRLALNPETTTLVANNSQKNQSERPRRQTTGLPLTSSKVLRLKKTERGLQGRESNSRHSPSPASTSSSMVVASPSLPIAKENDFLPPISLWTKLGGLFITGSVGVAIALAFVTKYKVTVKAQAIVRPAGELRIVQAAAEDSVRHIYVEENQVVKKGDVIATLDDSHLQTKKSQLQSNIQQAQLQLVQINAQITALKNQISAETDRINRVVASAEAELERRLRDYQDRLVTTEAEVKEAKANAKSVEAALNAAKSKEERYQSIAKEGVISQNLLEEAKLEVQQQQQAGEAAQAKLQSAQAALNPSYAEVIIAQQRIAQEKATGEANLATINKEWKALIQQKIEIEKQLERDTRELQQVEIDLSQTTITATADGIISKLNLRNPGQTVRSGEEIAQIVPSNAPLVINAAVSPSDISKLEEGQKVQMRVSACPYPDYGT
ncbi:MAG: HlyD family efflux transporter periplasmic adaptor subunit, partial [Xenococcaceae cyanobacterium MO_234.B1]|nr:HlyD family efflux transporter periplasmic adaptor subunit [Xenococcaceae cyanobacterium MO_234.B1]